VIATKEELAVLAAANSSARATLATICASIIRTFGINPRRDDMRSILAVIVLLAQARLQRPREASAHRPGFLASAIDGVAAV